MFPVVQLSYLSGKQMKTDNILRLAAQVIEKAKSHKKMITMAESCTGGLIAGFLTAIPGSSAVVDRGFVTYSNESKQELLNVSENNLIQYGAVSAAVAEEMASGALAASKAHISVSVTGIAGPGGGSPNKPVGLVFMGQAGQNMPTSHKKLLFKGDREAVRLQTVEEALKTMYSML